MRMLERSSDDHGQDQLALVICQGRIHVAAHLCAADLLAHLLVQNRRYVQVEGLVGKTYQSGGCQSTAIDLGVQVVGLRHAVLHVKVTGERQHVGKVLRTIEVAPHKLSLRRQLVQQIQIHELSVGEIDGQSAVETAGNGIR